jgi:hypothetical protein
MTARTRSPWRKESLWVSETQIKMTHKDKQATNTTGGLKEEWYNQAI